LTPGRIDQIVRDVAARAARNAAHRVRDVPIEPREEAEAVLARQIPPSAGAGSLQGETARLAASHREQLVDLDLEAALDQFVRGAQAGDPAAEDDDFVGHRRVTM
jgi:hypothetical protein